MADLLPLIVPVVTVMISVIASVLVATIRIGADIRKLKTELQQSYTKSLFEKRIVVYPELHSLLNAFARKIDYGTNTIENLRDLRDNLDDWNRQHSLFFASSTSNLSTVLRNYLYILLADTQNGNVTGKDWKLIRSVLGGFVMTIKAEIGIQDTETPGKWKGIELMCQRVTDRIHVIDSVSKKTDEA